MISCTKRSNNGKLFTPFAMMQHQKTHCTLLVAALGLIIVSCAQLASSSSYGGAESGGYGGYDAYGGQERPRVNLGISLKVPAMKINLGRMNMPKISIRAKIKQSHAPKVINVPEMHIDTQSKIPGPQGAQAAGGHGADSYGSQSGYGGSSSAGNYASGSQQSSYSSAPEYSSAPASYDSSSSSPSYGPSAPAPSNGYSGAAQQQQSGYEAPPSVASYEAPSSAYGQQQQYQQQQQQAEAEMAAYGQAMAGAPTYEQAGSSYASSAYSEPSAAAAPTNYGRKPYGAESGYSGAQVGGYGAAGPNNYGAGRAPAATRSQYGSTSNAYSSQQQYQAPRGYAQAQAGYAAPSSGYQQQQQSYGYQQQQAPRQSYQQSNSYGSSANYDAGKQASAGYSAPSYEPIGYQPLEPGHTLLTATNDNYDGMTQLNVASNPPKDPPRYSSYGSSSGQSYGSGSSSYGAQNSYGSSDSQTAPAYGNNNNNSYKPSGANSYSNSGNQNSYSNNNNYASQPIYDDNASSYGQSEQGNYGARMTGGASHNQQSGYQTEAY